VRLSLGEQLPEILSSRSDVRSHMFMMALLGQAEQGGTRQNLLREIWQASLQRGMYRESREELTPLRTDLLSLLPLFFLTTQLLISPAQGLATTSRAVTRYSLSSHAIQVIQEEMS
jgi:hypothetical protein